MAAPPLAIHGQGSGSGAAVCGAALQVRRTRVLDLERSGLMVLGSKKQPTVVFASQACVCTVASVSPYTHPHAHSMWCC